MKSPGIMLLALAVAVAASPSLAEDGTQPFISQQPGEAFGPGGQSMAPDRSGAEQRGSSGWANGRELTLLGVGSRGFGAPDAQDQPEMATGVDLKGPPVRFPADDTPE